jgi:hypothetical protein
MAGASRLNWWSDWGAEREELRIDLVGLASEISTVAGHALRELPRVGALAAADLLRSQCLYYLKRAHTVLRAEIRVDALTQDALVNEVLVFRLLAQRALRLRQEAAALANKVEPRWLSSML